MRMRMRIRMRVRVRMRMRIFVKRVFACSRTDCAPHGARWVAPCRAARRGSCSGCMGAGPCCMGAASRAVESKLASNSNVDYERSIVHIHESKIIRLDWFSPVWR